jgi:hypothetical protein
LPETVRIYTDRTREREKERERERERGGIERAPLPFGTRGLAGKEIEREWLVYVRERERERERKREREKEGEREKGACVCSSHCNGTCPR